MSFQNLGVVRSVLVSVHGSNSGGITHSSESVKVLGLACSESRAPLASRALGLFCLVSVRARLTDCSARTNRDAHGVANAGTPAHMHVSIEDLTPH